MESVEGCVSPKITKKPVRKKRVAKKKKSRTNVPAERWSERLIEHGFIPVSRTFLRNYAKLSPTLTVGEALFVIHLFDYKRDKKPPYPSYKTLATYMGVTDKMVRLHAKRLEEKGYLKRHVRVGLPNLFDLNPLIAELERQCLAVSKPRKKAS